MPHLKSYGGALEIQNVSRTFSVNGSTVVALDDVSLTVHPGEFVAILGASGCGKSTLLRAVAGLDRGCQGDILLDGRRIEGASLDRGLVFQEHRLFPWLTVEQNVGLALENAPLTRVEKRRAIAEHLVLVGLSDFARAYPHQLSGGMAQRAAIARGLVNRPKLLLLDEPLGALDALTRMRLQAELLRIWEHERITMILVTHDVDEALLLGDRVIVMSPRPGKIREEFRLPPARPRDPTDRLLARMKARIMVALGEAPLYAAPTALSA